MTESASDQNLGYAGFFFKKTLQPHSLRNEIFKQPNDFKDKNLLIYVNQKFKDMRRRLGTSAIPRSIFLQSILQTKSCKTDIHEILAQENVEQRQEKHRKVMKNLNKNQEIMRKKRYEPTLNSVNLAIMRKLNDRKSKETFVFESQANVSKKLLKKPTAIDNNPDRKAKAILHEKLSEQEIRETHSQYNKLRLKSKFQRLKSDKNFEKIDFNKKFRVINQLIHKEDEPQERRDFFAEICKKNQLSLDKILEIDEDALKLLEEPAALVENEEFDAIANISQTSSGKKRLNEKSHIRYHRRLSLTDIEEIIQKEEDDQAKNLIDIFKKTHEEPDEYRKMLTTAAASNKKMNFQDQLFQQINELHRGEVLKKLKKKNEFNEQKFVRSKKSFESLQKIKKLQFFDRLSSPKSQHPPLLAQSHRRVKTSSGIGLKSPQFTQIFITSPISSKNDNKIVNIFNKTGKTTQKSLGNQDFGNDFQGKKPISHEKERPFSSTVHTRTRTSLSNATICSKNSKNSRDTRKNSRILSSNHENFHRNSTKSLKKVQEDDEILEIPRETKRKARVSIFETYKSPENLCEKPGNSSETQHFEHKFRVLLQHRKENRDISTKFERFFQRCDADALTQSEETKTLKEDFKRFRQDYEKMHQTAHKNVERFGLFTSDTNFNQLREQAKFKKTLIEHLLERIPDKQGLISLYNKHVSMEENIWRNRKLLKNEEKPEINQ